MIILGKLCALLEFAPFQCHQLDIGLGQDAMRNTHIVCVRVCVCVCVGGGGGGGTLSSLL